jgi:hypothetical protein
MGLKRPVCRDFWDEAYVGSGRTMSSATPRHQLPLHDLEICGKDYFDIDAGVAAIKRAQPGLVDFTGTVEKQLEQKEVVMAVLHDASTYVCRSAGFRGLGRPTKVC